MDCASQMMHSPTVVLVDCYPQLVNFYRCQEIITLNCFFFQTVTSETLILTVCCMVVQSLICVHYRYILG